MSLWVVVGGQFGGEGKGKISAFITQQEHIDICIRCGGPNSGHSFVTESGDTVLLRQLPTGYIRPQLYHSDCYPKATSRDTTAAGFLSEVGLSPLLVTEIVLVFRTFPIRVAGEQAGPLKDEITWEALQEESGYPYPIQEMTTVSKKLRRVGRFDYELARAALWANRPTRIVVNGLDYLDFCSRGVKRRTLLTDKALQFLDRLEQSLGAPVVLCGTGPRLDQIVVPSQETCGLLQAV